MRESFKGFYDVSEDSLSEIWSSDSTLFILDTNILLNLYQYSQETQDEFFKILDIVQNRLWIPFHVALEYQRRRLDVIRNEKSVFSNINKKLATIKSMVSRDFSEFNLEARNTNLFDLEESFKKDLFSLIDTFKKEVDEADKLQPCVRSYDAIRAKLDALLEGKIGAEPTSAWVLDITKEGEVRYANKVPPGYEDVSKDKDIGKASFTFNSVTYERKYGDLIIWKQIIGHLKKQSGITNVIFITDDSKEDWWEILDSRGNKTIGARPELRSEIYAEAGIENFKMYRTNDFLVAAKEYYGVSIGDKAIEETGSLLNTWELNDLLNENDPNLIAADKYDNYRKALATFNMGITNTGFRDNYFETLANIRKFNSSLSTTDSYIKLLADIKKTNPSLGIADNYCEIIDNIKKNDPSLFNEGTYREFFNKIDEQNSEYEQASALRKFLKDMIRHQDDEQNVTIK